MQLSAPPSAVPHPLRNPQTPKEAALFPAPSGSRRREFASFLADFVQVDFQLFLQLSFQFLQAFLLGHFQSAVLLESGESIFGCVFNDEDVFFQVVDFEFGCHGF